MLKLIIFQWRINEYSYQQTYFTKVGWVVRQLLARLAVLVLNVSTYFIFPSVRPPYAIMWQYTQKHSAVGNERIEQSNVQSFLYGLKTAVGQFVLFFRTALSLSLSVCLSLSLRLGARCVQGWLPVHCLWTPWRLPYDASRRSLQAAWRSADS